MLYIYKNVQKQPPESFYTKSCSRNFVNFTGKHLCQCLFSNKLAGLFPHSAWILRIFPYSVRMRKRPATCLPFSWWLIEYLPHCFPYLTNTLQHWLFKAILQGSLKYMVKYRTNQYSLSSDAGFQLCIDDTVLKYLNWDLAYPLTTAIYLNVAKLKTFNKLL